MRNLDETEKQGAGRRKVPGTFHHGDLAEAMVAAATGLIERRGSADFSLREVAESVGVSHAAAYRHFAGKRDLLAEIAGRAFKALTGRLEAAVLRSGDRLWAGPSLAAMGNAYLDFAAENPGAYRVLFHPDMCERRNYPDLAAAAFAAFSLLADVIAEGQRNGEFAADQSPAALASSVWAAEHGYASLLLDRQISQDAPAIGDVPPADRALMLRLLVKALSVK